MTHIRGERLDGDLQLLVLDRAEKRNALTREIIAELTVQLEAASRDTGVRGLVLAGAGPSFCAGVDLHELRDGTPETVRALIDALALLCATVRRHPKPIVCALQGHCLGGALELAACCDLRVCTPEAQLGMPEVLLGIPSVIDAVMLGHLIGVGRARELLLTGDSISGQTALEWGLASRVAAARDLVDAAAGLLRRVTRHDAAVIAAQKRLHQDSLDLPYETAVERSKDALVEALRSRR